MRAVGQLLVRGARMFPERVALVKDGRSLTYGELNDAANRLAAALGDRRIGRGDRIAVLAPNCAESIIVWWATQKIGATFVPLNVRLLPHELRRHVRQAGCRAVFFAASMARIAAEIATEGLSQLVWVGLGPVSSESFPQPAMDFAELMTVGPCAERQQSLAGDAESLLLFTSGTSGASKGVVRTQDMVRDHALVLSVGHLAGNQPPVLVTAAPLYHTSGMLGVLKMTLLGGTLVLLDRVEAREVLVAIEHHAATELMLLPPVVYERLGAAGVDSYDLTSVQTILVSAGRCSVPTAELLFRMFPSARLRFSWGSTEVCSATGEEIDRSAVARDPGLLASVGTANALVEIVLVDDAGEAVPVGTPGEALVRSSMVCSEYLEGPDSVPDAFAPGGWFRTRDVLRADAQGRFYFVDRLADVVKSGGECIYAPEVERVLESHPSIAQAAVVRVPDPTLEEAVGAAVVLRPGADLDVEDVIRHCRRLLASYKKPRYVAVLGALPTNSLGKIDKSWLRAHTELFVPIARPAAHEGH